jgi:hypothetical protein
MVPLRYAANRTVTVAQWDGGQYHANAVWRSTGGNFVDHLLAYEPRWHFVYHQGGDLYQFEDAFVAGDGIRVMKPAGLTAPQITSTASTTAAIDTPYAYDDVDGLPEATGDAPLWWSLADGPAAARADPATGEIIWTPTSSGSFDFTLLVENDVGSAEQSFTVHVQDPNADAGVPPDAGPGPDAPSADADADNGGEIVDDGCSCRLDARRGSDPRSTLLLLLVVACALRASRKPRGRPYS